MRRVILYFHNYSPLLTTVNSTTLDTDEAILAEIGQRLARRRLDMGLTQAELAERAGLGKRTVERIESGKSAQMASVVRVLRAMDALAGLDGLIPDAGPSPMELLKRRGKARKRASSRRRTEAPARKWKWGDES